MSSPAKTTSAGPRSDLARSLGSADSGGKSDLGDTGGDRARGSGPDPGDPGRERATALEPQPGPAQSPAPRARAEDAGGPGPVSGRHDDSAGGGARGESRTGLPPGRGQGGALGGRSGPAGRPARRSGFALSRDGIALFYEVLGQRASAAVGGTSLLLCDGLGCDGFVWKYLQWALGERYRILHSHYRGHGRTPIPGDISRLSIADFAADLCAVLDTCETEQAVLVGHSMGVQVALELYKQAPERVAGLVLVCGSYGNPLRTFKGKDQLQDLLPLIRATVSRVPSLVGAFWKNLIPTELSYLLAKKIELNGALIKREDFFPYLESMARMDPRMFVSALAAAGQHNARDLLDQVHVPTLIVAGRYDSFTPMSLSEEMARMIPGAELHVVESGTHTAPIERPAEVTEIIESFLTRRVNGRSSRSPVPTPATPTPPGEAPK